MVGYAEIGLERRCRTRRGCIVVKSPCHQQPRGALIPDIDVVGHAAPRHRGTRIRGLGVPPEEGTILLASEANFYANELEARTLACEAIKSFPKDLQLSD